MTERRLYSNDLRNGFNRLTLFDKFSFGQFKGIEVGMIYLIKPDYIEWLLTTTDKYLVDIDDAIDMKVIQDLDVYTSVNLYGSGLNDEILGERFYKRFSFKDLIHSGFIKYKFSEIAIIKNNRKIAINNDRKLTKSFKYSEESIMHFVTEISELPNISFETKCIDSFKTSFGYQYFVFSFDNSEPLVPILRKCDNLKIASFFYPDWRITPKEFERKANAEMTFTAIFKKGRFFINK